MCSAGWHSIDCCFNIFFFQVPVKMNKNIANASTYMKNITKNTMYIVQELHSFRVELQIILLGCYSFS